MNLNDDVVYRRLRLGPLHQLHPGSSRSLVRHHDRLHRNCLLSHLPLWWKSTWTESPQARGDESRPPSTRAPRRGRRRHQARVEWRRVGWSSRRCSVQREHSGPVGGRREARADSGSCEPQRERGASKFGSGDEGSWQTVHLLFTTNGRMFATTAFYESGLRDLTRPARSAGGADAAGWGRVGASTPYDSLGDRVTTPSSTHARSWASVSQQQARRPTECRENLKAQL